MADLSAIDKVKNFLASAKNSAQRALIDTKAAVKDPVGKLREQGGGSRNVSTRQAQLDRAEQAILGVGKGKKKNTKLLSK